MSADERFWAKIDASGACWMWTASTNGVGYGQFWNGSRLVKAHRWSYERFVGPIPDGLQLDHLCRNRACVDPAHLEPVTGRTNVLRGATVVAAKAKQSHCIRGHLLAGGNLYVEPGGRKRKCKTCQTVQHKTRRVAA